MTSHGIVTDGTTGEPLLFAHVYQLSANGDVIAGTATDEQGRFSFDATPSVPLRITMVGYEPAEAMPTDAFTVYALRSGVDIPEVEIVAERRNFVGVWLGIAALAFVALSQQDQAQ